MTKYIVSLTYAIGLFYTSTYISFTRVHTSLFRRSFNIERFSDAELLRSYVWQSIMSLWHIQYVSFTRVHRSYFKRWFRPTQSVMYAPLQLNILSESILLIVQYKYLKSCSGDFYSPESDPPHKIMRYWFYYSIWLAFSFPLDHAGLVEMICTTGVPVSKGHLGGGSP